MIGIPLNDNGFDKKKSKVEDTSNFIHLNILHHDAQCDILLLENRFAELTKYCLLRLNIQSAFPPVRQYTMWFILNIL